MSEDFLSAKSKTNVILNKEKKLSKHIFISVFINLFCPTWISRRPLSSDIIQVAWGNTRLYSFRHSPFPQYWMKPWALDLHLHLPTASDSSVPWLGDKPCRKQLAGILSLDYLFDYINKSIFHVVKFIHDWWLHAWDNCRSTGKAR